MFAFESSTLFNFTGANLCTGFKLEFCFANQDVLFLFSVVTHPAHSKNIKNPITPTNAAIINIISDASSIPDNFELLVPVVVVKIEVSVVAFAPGVVVLELVKFVTVVVVVVVVEVVEFVTVVVVLEVVEFVSGVNVLELVKFVTVVVVVVVVVEVVEFVAVVVVVVVVVEVVEFVPEVVVLEVVEFVAVVVRVEVVEFVPEVVVLEVVEFVAVVVRVEVVEFVSSVVAFCVVKTAAVLERRKRFLKDVLHEQLHWPTFPHCAISDPSELNLKHNFVESKRSKLTVSSLVHGSANTGLLLNERVVNSPTSWSQKSLE